MDYNKVMRQQSVADNHTICAWFVEDLSVKAEEHSLAEHHQLGCIVKRNAIVQPQKRHYQRKPKVECVQPLHHFFLPTERRVADHALHAIRGVL